MRINACYELEWRPRLCFDLVQNVARNYVDINWNGNKRHLIYCFYECIIFAQVRFHGREGQTWFCVLAQEWLTSLKFEHCRQNVFFFTTDADFESRRSKNCHRDKPPSFFFHFKGYWVSIIVRNCHLAVIRDTTYSSWINLAPLGQ